VAALVLAALAACFVTLDLAGSNLHDAHSGARGVLGSLYRGSDSVLGPVRRFVQGVPDAGSNSQRISALEAENASLRAKLAAAGTDTATSTELAKLQLAAGTAGFTMVAAHVLAFGPGQGFDWTATIDVGRTSGVALDQTVTSGDGLIGRVVHADETTSVVLLAADPGSGVGVRDTRNGQLALATGAGAKGFTASPLDPAADIRVGDALETGPAGSSTYAGGLPLGTVTAVHTSAQGIVTLTVHPAMSPTAIDLVGVITAAGAKVASRPPVTGSR
jgi:rod shape-determining protein MreC